MLVQNLSFDGETIIVPLLLNVYQSPLPGTKPKVLNPRQHKHIIITVHATGIISVPQPLHLTEHDLCLW